jgi:hypothetical protein
LRWTQGGERIELIYNMKPLKMAELRA